MKGKNNPALLIITIIGMMIVGGFIGDLLKKYIGLFGYNYPIHFFHSPGNQWNIIDLNVVKLSFNLIININLGSVLGVLLGLYIFYKR